MQLLEDGLIDLDESLVTYIPSFQMLTPPGMSATVFDLTLRKMLTHHSGIPGDFFPEGFLPENSDSSGYGLYQRVSQS